MIEDIFINGLALDSRKVLPGNLFFAVVGETVDGRDFIQNAFENGAVCVLMEKMKAPVPVVLNMAKQSRKNIIEFPHLKESIGYIASRFYDEPTKKMSVIGITGTNGKTSCSHFIAELFTLFDKKCGIIGTLGVGFKNGLKETNITTPDPIFLQKTFFEFHQQGAKAAAMEVSSHALSQGRAEGIVFDTAVFTNLSRDHLDYHDTMENYWAAKKRLFTELNPRRMVINLDDEYGRELFEEVVSKNDNKNKKEIIGYTKSPLAPLCKGGDRPSQFDKERGNSQKIGFITTEFSNMDETGIRAKISTPWGEGEFQSSLFGNFNLSNLLATIAVLCLQGVPLKQVLNGISRLKNVPGRMTKLGGKGMPSVVIDYAHTPDALSNILKALKTHCEGKLWCVFGCGGDRDKGKRPMMASLAETLADYVVMTSDNPRTESPKQIMEDMLKGIKNAAKIKIEYDRAKAIEDTIKQANVEDIILIAGKGHEDYQIIGDKKIFFSDEQVVNKVLEKY